MGEDDIKEILEKQLQLLSEVSENLRRSDYPARDLTKLSVAMTGIAGLLINQYQFAAKDKLSVRQAEAYHKEIERIANLNQ